MDEDLAVIVKNTRKEQIKNFFTKNKIKIYFSLCSIIIILFSTFFYFDNIKRQKIEIANKFIQASTNFDAENKQYYLKQFSEIIDSHDSTYAPLALFFLIDNNVLNSNEEINRLFDQVINNTSLKREIKNLIIYKKALINADYQSEDKMIEILQSLNNSESIWKLHSLLLLGDYFLSRGEKEKAKDYYSQILISQKTNENIFNQVQLRIRRNFGE